MTAPVKGDRVTVRIFGQVLPGTYTGTMPDLTATPPVVDARIQLDRPTVIGGVGPARSVVYVSHSTLTVAA
jgi:hypothetical protein